MPEQGIPLAGYRRALRFIVPYWPRLALILLAGVAATAFGLVQPYISKLLIDEALLKRNLHALFLVSALMVAVTIVVSRSTFSRATNTCASQQLCCSICGWRCTGICRRSRRVFGPAPAWATWCRGSITISPRSSAFRPTAC